MLPRERGDIPPEENRQSKGDIDKFLDDLEAGKEAGELRTPPHRGFEPYQDSVVGGVPGLSMAVATPSSVAESVQHDSLDREIDEALSRLQPRQERALEEGDGEQLTRALETADHVMKNLKGKPKLAKLGICTPTIPSSGETTPVTPRVGEHSPRSTPNRRTSLLRLRIGSNKTSPKSPGFLNRLKAALHPLKTGDRIQSPSTPSTPDGAYFDLPSSTTLMSRLRSATDSRTSREPQRREITRLTTLDRPICSIPSEPVNPSSEDIFGPLATGGSYKDTQAVPLDLRSAFMMLGIDDTKSEESVLADHEERNDSHPLKDARIEVPYPEDSCSNFGTHADTADDAPGAIHHALSDIGEVGMDSLVPDCYAAVETERAVEADKESFDDTIDHIAHTRAYVTPSNSLEHSDNYVLGGRLNDHRGFHQSALVEDAELNVSQGGPDLCDHPMFRNDPFSILPNYQGVGTITKEQAAVWRNRQQRIRSEQAEQVAQVTWAQQLERIRYGAALCAAATAQLELEEEEELFESFRAMMGQADGCSEDAELSTSSDGVSSDVQADARRDLRLALSATSLDSASYDSNENSDEVVIPTSDFLSPASRFSDPGGIFTGLRDASHSSKAESWNATPRSRPAGFVASPQLLSASMTSSLKSSSTGDLPAQSINLDEERHFPALEVPLNFPPGTSDDGNEASLPAAFVRDRNEIIIAQEKFIDSDTASTISDKDLTVWNGQKLWKRVLALLKSNNKADQEKGLRDKAKLHRRAREMFERFELEWEEHIVETYGSDTEAIQAALMKRMRAKLDATAQDYNIGDPFPRHPNTSRGWYHKNLRCTICPDKTDCPHCHDPCCAWSELKGIMDSETVEPSRQEEAIVLLQNLEKLRTGREVPTFLTCSTCHEKICPRCCGRCPDETYCQDIQCYKCKSDPWAICDWHKDL